MEMYLTTTDNVIRARGKYLFVKSRQTTLLIIYIWN